MDTQSPYVAVGHTALVTIGLRVERRTSGWQVEMACSDVASSVPMWSAEDQAMRRASELGLAPATHPLADHAAGVCLAGGPKPVLLVRFEVGENLAITRTLVDTDEAAVPRTLASEWKAAAAGHVPERFAAAVDLGRRLFWARAAAKPGLVEPPGLAVLKEVAMAAEQAVALRLLAEGVAHVGGSRATAPIANALHAFDALANQRVVKAWLDGLEPPYGADDLLLFQQAATRGRRMAKLARSGIEGMARDPALGPAPGSYAATLEAALQEGNLTAGLEATIRERIDADVVRGPEILTLLADERARVPAFEPVRARMAAAIMEKPELAERVWHAARKWEVRVQQQKGGHWCATAKAKGVTQVREAFSKDVAVMLARAAAVLALGGYSLPRHPDEDFPRPESAKAEAAKKASLISDAQMSEIASACKPLADRVRALGHLSPSFAAKRSAGGMITVVARTFRLGVIIEGGLLSGPDPVALHVDALGLLVQKLEALPKPSMTGTVGLVRVGGRPFANMGPRPIPQAAPVQAASPENGAPAPGMR